MFKADGWFINQWFPTESFNAYVWPHLQDGAMEPPLDESQGATLDPFLDSMGNPVMARPVDESQGGAMMAPLNDSQADEVIEVSPEEAQWD